MTPYLALSIGPIIKTLVQARKTRELWAASYLLSRLMEHLCLALDPKNDQLIIPRIDRTTNVENRYGAGIYPDRLFMEATDLLAEAGATNLAETADWEKVMPLVDTKVKIALTNLAKDCLLADEVTDEETVKEAVGFWAEFFRIRYVLENLDNIQNGRLSTVFSPYLDSMELEDTGFAQAPSENYFLKFLNTSNFFNAPLTHHLKAGKGRYAQIMPGVFPSTSNISAYELFVRFPEQMKALPFDDRKDAHEQFFEAIESNRQLATAFHTRHKYFCIVQADGDSVGAAIQQLNTKKDYTFFSETLSAYALTAAKKIDDFGGKPIYIGGDDLLFLCPVRSDKGSVLDLVNELDDAFPADQFPAKVTLSFGINIIYYKFPLFEAIEDVYTILRKAKSYKNKSGDKKNAISFQFTKHSQQVFDATYSKKFAAAVDQAMAVFNAASMKQSGELVSSLIYKLASLKKLINDIINHVGNDKKEDLKHRLEQTMNHYFNEWKNVPSFHQQKTAIIDLLLAAIDERGENASDLFYATMRLIQFIIAPSNENSTTHDTENIAQTIG